MNHLLHWNIQLPSSFAGRDCSLHRTDIASYQNVARYASVTAGMGLSNPSFITDGMASTCVSIDDSDEHSLVKEKELTGLVHRLDMYDLGLFFNPPGFLVALRQEVVRLKRAQATKTPWSVEDTRLKTSILRSNLSGKLLLPKLGTNLYGLTMEGAAWDGHQLVEQNLQQDVTPMPVVALSVVHARAAQFDGRSFHCPVYRCSGSREKAFEISLPTDVSADHWILRGAALFLGRKLD